ncbi:MAG: adenosine deaminase [Chloroflexota bacterium]
MTAPTEPQGSTDPPMGDRAWLQALPKAELHLHLSGSVRPATAVRLARERDRYPELSDAALAARLVAPARCADQAELLRAFEVPVALLQDAEALSTAATELVEDVASDGTTYAEIRFAPASHARGGLSVPGVIAAVAAGVRAGLAAAPGTAIRLIAIAMRTDPPQRSLEVARAAAAARADGMVGFDLAGLEATAPDLAPQLPAFRLARASGLGISVHAGEWGGAAQVRAALTAEPDRIAHGGPAIDDPALMRELTARGIALDLCPTSNVQAGLVPEIRDHPLPRLLRAGVPVTLSTDDRTVSATTLVEEGLLALGPLGLTRAELVDLERTALRVAFLHHEEALRSRLVAELEAWVQQHAGEGSHR